MASSFTGLGTELMTTGENAGTWGTTTNTNLQIIEQMVGGYTAQSIAGGAQTTTLSVSDGSAGAVLAHRIIEFTGTITGNQVVTIPLDVQQMYIVKNNTSGAYTVQFKYVSGSGSSVTWGTSDKGTKLLYATADDGTNPNLVDSNIGGVGAVDLNGATLTLDADGDTDITADTDDQIDIKIAGADDFQFTANTFTAQSGSTIAAQALTATTVTASGIVKTDDTTAATSTTDGSLQTDGGLSVAADAVIGDDLKLLSDSAVLSLGADSDTTLTHTDGTGLTLNSTNKLTFGDVATYINQSSDGVMTVAGEATIDLTASTAVLVSNDLKLDSDSAVLGFGADNDTTLTHTDGTGLTLNSTNKLCFYDTALSISSSTDGQLDIDADTEVEIATTTLDLNGALDVSGASQFSGAITVGVDDTGLDVKFFGASAGAYGLYDQSADALEVRGATAAGAGLLKLTTGELTVVDADKLGRIDFQAPLEASGTDAILVGASIWAEADDTFAAGVNNTDLVFALGKSEAAAEKFRFTADGEIGIAGANYGTDGQVLTSGGAGAAVAWETITAAAVTALNNATANELVTVGATTTELDAEANLTFDGTTLTATALTVDDVAVDGKVVTMTGSTSDTAVFTAGTNGTLSIVTTDAAAAAANIQITADGTVDIDSAGVLTLDSGAAINIEPAAGSAILLDGTISVDAGVVTGATSITSTAFVGDITGDVTGNASGTAATVTTAAQTNITSLGTLTALTVDDVAINGKVVTMTGSTSDTAVLTAGTNGTLSIVTTDAAAAAANMTLTADGTFEADGTTVTLDSAGDVVLDAGGADVFLKDDGTLFGTLTQSGGELVIKSSSSGTTALTFSGANATFAGTLATAAGGFNIAGLDIDGATDIGADIVDADLFIVDDGAGGTNRKVAASRVKTYIGGGTSWQAVKTGAYTASAGQGVFVNTTSAAITLTLPASPSIGDEVSFIDYAGTFDSNNLTIGRNSEKIHGADEDLTVATERAANTLVYTDSTQGWLLKSK